MGFDLYGLNPTENTEGPPILSKFKDNDGWNNWEEMTKKDKVVSIDTSPNSGLITQRGFGASRRT